MKNDTGMVHVLSDGEIDNVNGGNPAIIAAIAGYVITKWITTDWSDLPGGVAVWQD